MTVVGTRSITHCTPNLLYFENVKNAKDVLQKAMKGDLSCALLNPNLVVHPFQVLVAAQYAVDAYLSNQMKTKNVFVEILYNISPSKKITEALKYFGINEQSNEIICVTLDSDSKKEIEELVDGRMVELDELPNDSTKISNIKKIYAITEGELQTASIVDILVNRISVKTVNKS